MKRISKWILGFSLIASACNRLGFSGEQEQQPVAKSSADIVAVAADEDVILGHASTATGQEETGFPRTLAGEDARKLNACIENELGNMFETLPAKADIGYTGTILGPGSSSMTLHDNLLPSEHAETIRQRGVTEQNRIDTEYLNFVPGETTVSGPPASSIYDCVMESTGLRAASAPDMKCTIFSTPDQGFVDCFNRQAVPDQARLASSVNTVNQTMLDKQLQATALASAPKPGGR